MTDVKLMLGNCLDRLKDLDDNSVDSIVTDPPYGIDFMGKKWDYDVPSTEIWEQALRVLKPGGYLLAFAGTRTQHRMAVRIEDAGFEIRDMIAWVYGSGFPKSLNISKSLDKMAGAEREIIGKHNGSGMTKSNVEQGAQKRNITEWNTYSDVPVTDEAKQWHGWGTALKPALEPITLARKPFKGSVANNVLEHGTGGINIDDCRILSKDKVTNHSRKSESAKSKGIFGDSKAQNTYQTKGQELGRFPANFIHDGSEEVTELFPNSNGGGFPKTIKAGSSIDFRTPESRSSRMNMNDNGSAARFFYCAKTSKKDRNDGAENNNHPTVKPTDLMRYLVTMVTPKGGTTLDPFMGSGSTGRGAKLGGFNFIGIELDPDYLEIAKARIDAIVEESTLDEFFT